MVLANANGLLVSGDVKAQETSLFRKNAFLFSVVRSAEVP